MTYAELIIADAPEGYWRFLEASGTLSDEMGNYDASPVGSPSYAQTGPVDKALGVSTNNAAKVAVNPGLTVPYTLEAWVYANSAELHGIAIADNATNNHYTKIAVGDATYGSSAVRRNGGSGADTTDHAVASDGVQKTAQWVHVVGVARSTSLLEVYVNGSFADSSTVSCSAITGLDEIDLGYVGDTTPSWGTGRIAEVAMYDYDLTSTQIADHYAKATANTGDAALTLGGITFAATGEQTGAGVTADAAFTLGTITFSATGEQPIVADAAFTLGTITFAATGEQPIVADAAFTLGGIIFSATNQTNSDGEAAFTLGGIAFSATAAFGTAVSFTTSNIQFESTGMLILYTNIQQTEVANDVYVCNLALGRLGEYQLMALTERTVPARNCNRFYLGTVDEVLREHQWNFATGHATLTELATNPGAIEWLHAYQLPSDFIRLRRLNNWTEEDEFTHWEIEKDVLLTDDDKAEIKYTRKITNVALWDPMAIEALSLKLAYKLAVPITGSIAIAQQLFSEYQQVVMPRAQRVDASEAKQRHKPAWATSALVQSRGAGS